MADIKKFLDKAGTTHLWGKIIDELAKKDDLGAAAAVEAKLGNLPAGSTVMEEIQKAQSTATYDDTEVRGLIGANAAAVATLNGEDTGKSVRTIAVEELTKQLIPETAKEAMNELQEIAAWIQAHPEDAAAMNGKIAALEAAVGKPADGDVAATGLYLTDAENAAEIARVAGLLDELTASVGALGALAKKNTIKNADVADDAAIAMAKIDGLVEALANKQDTIPANTYDAYGSAAAVLGVDGDTHDKNTVFGAKAYTDYAIGNLDTTAGLTTTEIDEAIAEAIAASQA